FLHHPPSPQHPRDLGLLASGAHLQIVDYAPAIEGKLNPKPASDDGAPALHFTIATAMMNQHLDGWLLADDPQHGNFSMGLANIELKRGTASDSGRGDSPNRPPSESEANPKDQEVDVEENLGRDVPIETTPFTLRIENYWPDFRIENGKPSSLSDQPNNPAALVTISGRGAAAATSPESHGTGKQVTATGGPPAMPAHGEETPNHLTLFIADDGAITYELASRKNGKSPGKLELNKPLPTGWADWQLVVDQTMPSAQAQMDFTPVKSGQTSASLSGAADLPDGVRLRVQQNGETIERWAPAGWQITIPTSPSRTLVAYGWKTVSLPIGLELINFEVKRNEGSDSPAGFKSTLRIVTADGDSATGACWMNNPFSYPGAWWRTWTGLTYKISQASWNPENVGKSTVQILRDPGWLLKWIGSLLVVIGVFMMFYLQPYRKQTEGEPITPSAPNQEDEVVRAEAVAEITP